MKVIDQSEFRDEDGGISLENRIRGSLRYGLGWYAEMQAQDYAMHRLKRGLGDDHILVRNMVIPGTTFMIPMVLLSPQGVRVINTTPTRGVFRAKGEEWQSFDGRTRRFKTTMTNPQTQTLRMAQVLHHYLRELNYDLPDVEAILIFTNPHAHIDQVRPRVHIVQTDGIGHFAANLIKYSTIMDEDDIAELTEVIVNPTLLEPKKTSEAMLEKELPQERTPLPIPTQSMQASDFYVTEPVKAEAPILTASLFERLQLTKAQWILLATLTFFELIIILTLAALVYVNSLY